MSDTRYVGRPNLLRYAFGVAIPCMMLSSAAVIALFVAAGADAGPGLSTGFTLALVLVISLEVLRRHVFATGHAVALFRTCVWCVIAAGLPVTLLVAAGVLSGCYGHGCTDMSRVMLPYMLVWCVLILPLLPLGRSLLQKADWLQPAAG